MTAPALARPTLTDPIAPPSRRALDAQLVEACRAGDATAERRLYEQNVDAVYRVALKLCGDRDLAADVTQEAFTRAFDRLSQYRGDAALRTWLTAIVATSAGMAMRRVRIARNRFAAVDDTIPAHQSPRADYDLSAKLATAIAALPDKLRVVFVMHDVEGLTHGEISAATQVPTGTTKTRLAEARARLRVELEPHWRDKV